MREHVEAVGVDAAPARWRRRRVRLSAGHLLVVLAAIVAFVANLAVLRGQDERVEVLVAARDLPAGATLQPGDLRPESVPAEAARLGAFLAADRPAAIEGMVVTRPLPAGVPVADRDLRSAAAPSRMRSMSIPVDRERAVGGDIAVGDRVDVIHVDDGAPGFVLSGAEVVGVSSGNDSALGSASAYWVVVAVDAEGALRLAAALAGGGVDLVRSTGAPPAPVEEASDS